jgi:hypothetical protein
VSAIPRAARWKRVKSRGTAGIRGRGRHFGDYGTAIIARKSFGVVRLLDLRTFIWRQPHCRGFGGRSHGPHEWRCRPHRRRLYPMTPLRQTDRSPLHAASAGVFDEPNAVRAGGAARSGSSSSRCGEVPPSASAATDTVRWAACCSTEPSSSTLCSRFGASAPRRRVSPSTAAPGCRRCRAVGALAASR